MNVEAWPPAPERFCPPAGWEEAEQAFGFKVVLLLIVVIHSPPEVGSQQNRPNLRDIWKLPAECSDARMQRRRLR